MRQGLVAGHVYRGRSQAPARRQSSALAPPEHARHLSPGGARASLQQGRPTGYVRSLRQPAAQRLQAGDEARRRQVLLNLYLAGRPSARICDWVIAPTLQRAPEARLTLPSPATGLRADDCVKTRQHAMKRDRMGQVANRSFSHKMLPDNDFWAFRRGAGMALQCVGQGFESPRLHSFRDRWRAGGSLLLPR